MLILIGFVYVISCETMRSGMKELVLEFYAKIYENRQKVVSTRNVPVPKPWKVFGLKFLTTIIKKTITELCENFKFLSSEMTDV